MGIKTEVPHSRFDWIGLVALLVGIEIPIRLFAASAFDGLLLQVLIVACLLILCVFVRHYNWKNFLIAILLISVTHPIRVITNWWVNPLLFGVATIICLLLMIRIIQKQAWKNGIVALLLICTLLSGWQTLVSTSEVGHCFIDDIRWTKYFACPESGGYQQIESSPIGMQGYCYYCPWYVGVRRW